MGGWCWFCAWLEITSWLVLDRELELFWRRMWAEFGADNFWKPQEWRAGEMQEGWKQWLEVELVTI